MIYIKWLALTLIKFFVMFPTLLVAPQVIALFTREMPHNLPSYSWGGLWGTFDNPPQGDEGFVEKHSFFPNVVTGWRGYINRVQWMWRNKLYGFNKATSIEYNPAGVIDLIGEDGISDKYKIPGWYFVRVRDSKTMKVVGFEFYGIFPWMPEDKTFSVFRWTFKIKAKNLRVRIGWKILTDKYQTGGFAPLVNTFNPVDGYGKD